MSQTQPKTILKSGATDVTLTWIRDDNLEKYTPFFQVYGICFNNKDEILIINEGSGWKIPGGHPENDESAEETLKRELIEEADVEVSQCIPLGAQRIDFPNNPNTKEGDLFYQLRLICLINKVLPQTIDPANGKISERKFVPIDEVTTWVKWGNGGNAMFQDAIGLYKKHKNDI